MWRSSRHGGRMSFCSRSHAVAASTSCIGSMQRAARLSEDQSQRGMRVSYDYLWAAGAFDADVGLRQCRVGWAGVVQRCTSRLEAKGMHDCPLGTSRGHHHDQCHTVVPGPPTCSTSIKARHAEYRFPVCSVDRAVSAGSRASHILKLCRFDDSFSVCSCPCHCIASPPLCLEHGAHRNVGS